MAVIPWSKLARTRDVLDPAYFALDPALIRSMARKDIPLIAEQIGTVINDRAIGRALQASRAAGRETA